MAFVFCFDTIDHKLLLFNFVLNGVKGNELQWFISYLSNIRQVVRYHGRQSKAIKLTVGYSTRWGFRTRFFLN